MSATAGAIASTLDRLRNIAEAGGLSFNDVLQSYVIERFLARMARLPDAETVLLKGALMLKAWGVPHARPTMDIDLLRRGAADRASLIDLVSRCAALKAEDVVEFDADSIVAEPITENAAYVGTRPRPLTPSSATSGQDAEPIAGAARAVRSRRGRRRASIEVTESRNARFAGTTTGAVDPG